MVARRLLERLRARSHRYVALAACALPALGVGLPARHGGVVATFFYACPGPGVAPTVRTSFTAAARPAPRPKSAKVDVYLRGRKPARRYQLVGTVDVLAHSSHTGVDELQGRAMRAARQMGGDAIVDVWYDDAANVRPRAGEQGMLYLTASVARWE